MIKSDLDKGMVQASGNTPEILVEYTVLTAVILRTLVEELDEENAMKVLAEMGKAAANNYNEPTDSIEEFKNFLKDWSDKLEEV